MKKILFSLLVLFVAFSGVNANGVASPSPLGMSIVKSGDVFKVYYKGETSGPVKVSIYNAKGHIVWNETLKNRNNFMRPYNFSSLPQGEYSIIVTDGNGNYTKRIRHSIGTSEAKSHLSLLDKEEQKYLLTVPNHGAESLTVKIFDQTENLVYQNVEAVNGDFGKVYDLENFHGAFTFEITNTKGKTDRIVR